MTRPPRITVNSGDNSWEAQLNANLQNLFDRPLPPLLHAGTLSDLESTRPAAQFQWCLAIVDYDGGTTPGQHFAFSNGTAWKLVSNWEFFNRRTFRVVSGGITVADIDDVIVVPVTATITLPAISDANEGRPVHLKNTGSGTTMTVATTGADTIDGAASLASTTQYEAFTLVSDGTSNWHVMVGGASGGGGGATAFTGLSDTPGSYSGEGGKKVKVNSGATALEFIADTILSLSDTPGTMGTAGQILKVNAGATALEFADESGGGGGSYAGEVFDQRRTAGDGTQTITTDTVVEFPTNVTNTASGTVFTYDAVTNHDLTFDAGGMFEINYGLTFESTGDIRVTAEIQIDTGAGFGSLEDGSSKIFDGGSTRHSQSSMIRRQFNAGDKIRVVATELTALGVNIRSGSYLSALRLNS